MKRDPVTIGRWYLRPDGSARCPVRTETREGWAAVRYLQVMRRVAVPRVQEASWWPPGIPRP